VSATNGARPATTTNGNGGAPSDGQTPGPPQRGLSDAWRLIKALWLLVRGDDGRGRKLRWLFGLLKPYRSRVAVMLVALVIATAAGLAPPYLAGQAVDKGIVPKDAGALTLIVVAFLASALIYWLATYAQTYLVGWVGQRALQDLRERIYTHLQAMSIGFYTRNRPGVLISRMTNDVQALDTLVTDGVVTMISSTLTLVGVVVILLLIDPVLALVTFLTFPILAIGSLIFRIASASAYRLTREKIANITAYLQETLSGVRVVRSFGQEERHLTEMARLNEENRAVNMRTVYLNAYYFPAVELLSAIGTAAILLFGGYEVINGNVQIGVLITFVGYLQTFFDPIQQISQLYTTYQQGMAALDKIFDLLDTEPDTIDRPDAIDPGQIRGAIDLEGVWFSYAEDQRRGVIIAGGGADEDGGSAEPSPADDHGGWALRNIDLRVLPGQTVALVGETGAGKSTLAKLIARFYDPQRGRILVDGHDVRELDSTALRSQLGIVPQEGFLFSGTIAENVAFGRPGASDEDVLDALATVGGAPMVEALPKGIATEVGERGAQLSAGQRQIVAFARALLAEPRILILDEATSNVDVRTERRIEQGLERLLAGRTAIVIAHRLSTIRRAARIVVLEGGEIAESGTHEELLEAGGAYASLYGTWAGQTAA
jgi:ABC-type multidrug transport system fused ATPase/permease subunit